MSPNLLEINSSITGITQYGRAMETDLNVLN